MAEAQESLALSPELSLVRRSDSDLEHRSEIMWAWEWENKNAAHKGHIFFHKLPAAPFEPLFFFCELQNTRQMWPLDNFFQALYRRNNITL